MSRVLIAELSPSGHRLQYVKYVAARASSIGLEPVLVCPAAVSMSDQYQVHLAKQPLDLLVETEDSVVRGIRPWVNEVLAVAQQVDAARVVVPDGDRFAAYLSIRPRPLKVPVTTLLMRSPYLLSPTGSARDRGVQTLKIASARIAGMRRGLRLIHLAGPGSPSHPGVRLARDPVELNESVAHWPADLQLGAVEMERIWFGVFGNIDDRKNVPLIIDALTHASLPAWGLLLAGVVSPEVLKEVERWRPAAAASGGVLLAANRLLSENEFWGLLRSVDCVVVATSTEGSSGVLLRAAAAGTRLVAAGSASVLAHRRALGVGWEAGLSVSELADALERAVACPPPDPIAVPTPSEFADELLGAND